VRSCEGDENGGLTLLVRCGAVAMRNFKRDRDVEMNKFIDFGRLERTPNFTEV
jgi:hypothetical protein